MARKRNPEAPCERGMYKGYSYDLCPIYGIRDEIVSWNAQVEDGPDYDLAVLSVRRLEVESSTKRGAKERLEKMLDYVVLDVDERKKKMRRPSRPAKRLSTPPIRRRRKNPFSPPGRNWPEPGRAKLYYSKPRVGDMVLVIERNGATSDIGIIRNIENARMKKPAPRGRNAVYGTAQIILEISGDFYVLEDGQGIALWDREERKGNPSSSRRKKKPAKRKATKKKVAKKNPKKSGGFTAAQNKKLRLGWAKAQPGFMISETVLSKPVRALALYRKGSKWGSGVINSNGQLVKMVEAFKHSSAFAAAKSAENIVLEKPKKKAAKKKVAKKKVAKKVTKKKAARKKTPPYQLLINRCQKLWDYYCERPSKKRLKPVLEHLDKMKASTSKKVADERKSCLRIANKEAKRLKMK